MSDGDEELPPTADPVVSPGEARQAIGNHGEDYVRQAFSRLDLGKKFEVLHLGTSWPLFDFLIEARVTSGPRPFAFLSVRTTAQPRLASGNLRVHRAVEELRRMNDHPAPTCLVGVDAADYPSRGFLASANGELAGLRSLPAAFPLECGRLGRPPGRNGRLLASQQTSGVLQPLHAADAARPAARRQPVMIALKPTASPPLTPAEETRIAAQRANSLAYLLLCTRDDLVIHVGRREGNVPLDLAVSLSETGTFSSRRFDIEVRAALDDEVFADPDGRPGEPTVERRWLDLPSPAILFLIHAVMDEMKYRWLLRPVVENGRTDLSARGNDWRELNPAALDHIVGEVAAWYDAARRDAPRPRDGPVPRVRGWRWPLPRVSSRPLRRSAFPSLPDGPPAVSRSVAPEGAEPFDRRGPRVPRRLQAGEPGRRGGGTGPVSPPTCPPSTGTRSPPSTP